MLVRLLPALACLAVCLYSQTVTGTLEGRVLDSSGAVITGARLTVKNQETGLTRGAVTNQEGFYQLSFLPVGSYTATAEAAGFAASSRTAPVELNSTRVLDFQLLPAAVSTQVTVVEEVPLLDTTRGDVKANLDEKILEDRPLSSRNFLSLVEMLPGFQSTGGYSGVNNPTLSSGSYVSFNGTGSRSVAFQIDGVNNDDSSEGINRQNVNISAIKQFQVLTNAYSAEFGRAGGAIVLVQTRSGTNRFHGDAYDYFQNQVLNANGFFANSYGRKPDGGMVSPRAPYRRNQFGYTVGGPLRRDRLFFFHSFEQTRLVQYNTYTRFIFLPTEKLQVGDCRLCLRPEEHPNLQADLAFLQSILDRFPKATPNNLAACDHCYTETKAAYYPDQDYSGRLDYNPTRRDTLALRYQYSRQRRKPLPLIWGETAFQNNKQQNVGLTATHMFTATLWGEFRFGIGLRTTLVDISSGNQTPILRISNPTAYSTTTMGSAGQFPIHRYQTDYQFVYNLSHVRGRHILKTGIDFRRQHLDDLADNYSRGWWTFGATGVLGASSRYEGFENFLRGYVTSFEKGFGNFTTFNRLRESNQYIMDDIKLTPRFTLNLGFRWEVVFKPSEVNNKTRYEYSTFTRGYQPRIGWAWSPKPASPFWRRLTGGENHFVVRGGFGLFHNRIFQSVFSQGGISLRSLPPWGVYKAFDATFNVGDPSGGFAYDPSYDPGRITIVKVDPNLGMPTIQQYNFTLERQVAGGLTVSAGYNRTRGIGLLQNQVTNRAQFPILSPVNGVLYDKIDPDLGNTQPAPGYISLAQPRTTQRRPDPRYGSVYWIGNGSWSYFNALRLEVRKRLSRGLHWQFYYTFGKSIDTGSDVTGPVALTEFGSARSLRGLSDFSQRHRMSLNYGYTLPWFAKSRGLKQAAFGGWTLSGTLIFASGNPFTVTAGYDLNADSVANDRPILLDAALYHASVDNGRTDPASGQQISKLQLPVTGFYPTYRTTQAQRPFDPGGSGKDSLGRNTFFGPGIRNFDLGISKSFLVREGHHLSFRAEMYSTTNTPRFALPTASVLSQSFGAISGTYNPLNFVGASRNDTASRFVQLALRYTF